MDKHEAHDILQRAKIDHRDNFFALRQEQVSALLVEADRAKYRQPKNANGSRARYFHARLIRALNRKED